MYIHVISPLQIWDSSMPFEQTLSENQKILNLDYQNSSYRANSSTFKIKGTYIP